MSETNGQVNGQSPSPGILLIEQDSGLRKSMRRQLEGDGHAVLAVNSMGEALARLRLRHYELVLCTNRRGSRSLADDYDILIDASGLLARSTSGYEVYLPGIGIDARAVVIFPTGDPQRVASSVRDVRSRLERTLVSRNAPPVQNWTPSGSDRST